LILVSSAVKPRSLFGAVFLKLLSGTDYLSFFEYGEEIGIDRSYLPLVFSPKKDQCMLLKMSLPIKCHH
jgi:hypothetical protein